MSDFYFFDALLKLHFYEFRRKFRGMTCLIAGALLSLGMTSTFASKENRGLRAVTEYTAFGSEISSPSLAAQGTVLGRFYYTPQQLCGGKSTCTLYGIFAFPNGGSSDSYNSLITTNVSGVSVQLLIGGVPMGGKYGGSTSAVVATISSPVEIQLIRDGRPLVAGSLKGVAGGRFYWVLRQTGNLGDVNIYLAGKISIISGTCSVPNQSIHLTPAQLTGFKGIGTTAGKHAFNINLENCPAGLNRVGHLLTAVGGEVGGIRGALKPTAGSTATGVAIKLTDASDAPATFGTSLPVISYDKAVGGTVSVPMNASYVQTGATVSSGTVKGAVQVLLDYQ